MIVRQSWTNTLCVCCMLTYINIHLCTIYTWREQSNDICLFYRELFTGLKLIRRQLPPDVVGECAYSDDSQDDVTSGAPFGRVGQVVRPSLTCEWNESHVLSGYDVIVSCAECTAMDRTLSSRQPNPTGAKLCGRDISLDDVRWRAITLPRTTCPTCRLQEINGLSSRCRQYPVTYTCTDRNFRQCMICETT